MCGFYFSFFKNKVGYNFQDNFNRFNKVKHRGIDFSDFIELKKEHYFFLGHHRLSINDPHPRSNQPFQSDCQKYYLLFNGEIFNYKKLKENLNYNFKTSSDTEVILAGYIKEGFDFFKKLEGFFSIVILDLNLNKIILHVDPTSVKLLYYQKHSNSLMVASEISCLHDITSEKDLISFINPIAIQNYYQFGYIHAPNTIYKNTFKLEPGELIEMNFHLNREIFHKRFHQHQSQIEQIEFEELLIQAHHSRLMADVPIAHFLSSGIDSTLSSTIYSKYLNKKNIHAYTLSLEDKLLDEAPLAVSQTKKLKLNNDILKVGEVEIIDEFKNYSQYIDEPFGDSSAILVSLLSKYVSQKYKVAISSDGGDELLYGYQRHYFFKIFFWLNFLPNFIKKIIAKIVKSKMILVLMDLLNVKHQSLKINKILSMLESENLYHSYFNLLKINSDMSTKKIIKNWFPFNPSSNHPIKNNISSVIKEIDYQYYLPAINYKNDRCGMQYSLEIREPLLNFDLVRYSFKKALSMIDIFKPKAEFIKILKKNDIKINSSKHGFSFSQKQLLETNNYELLDDLIKNQNFLESFFDTLQILQMIEEFKDSRKYVTELYLLCHLSLWLQSHKSIDE